MVIHSYQLWFYHPWIWKIQSGGQGNCFLIGSKSCLVSDREGADLLITVVPNVHTHFTPYLLPTVFCHLSRLICVTQAFNLLLRVNSIMNKIGFTEEFVGCLTKRQKESLYILKHSVPLVYGRLFHFKGKHLIRFN